MEYWSAIKGINSDAYSSMDESQRNLAKLRKPKGNIHAMYINLYKLLHYAN